MPSPETGSCPPSAAAPTRSRRDACDVPPRPSDESARFKVLGAVSQDEAAATPADAAGKRPSARRGPRTGPSQLETVQKVLN